MSYTEKPSTIRFGGIYMSGERESEIFRVDERNADPEALICLNCNLPANKCKPLNCQRYKDEMRKIKETHK